MLILISNPSKQYTIHTFKAIQQQHNVWWATSFWHNPHKGIGKWLQKIGKLQQELNKKADNSIPAHQIITHFTGIIYKFLGRFLIRDIERWSFYEDRIHDAWVSKKIQQLQPNLVIGYEKSCINTFTKAKRLGCTCMLDLSQVHVHFIEQLRQEYPFFAPISGSTKLFQKIKKIKLAEYQLADSIIVLSNFAKNTLVQNGIAENKIRVANLGFQPTTFFPTVPAYKNKKLQLIFVGIVTYRKGIHLLIQLMQELQHLPIHLTVVGPRGDASELLNTQNNYTNITYIPYAHHHQLAKQLQIADVFVLPSFLDSWAAVVIEAMACGLPAIVSTNTGAKEAIDSHCGFVIETGNYQQLKEKVLYFLNEPNQLQQYKANAAKQAQTYTWQQYYTAWQKIVNN